MPNASRCLSAAMALVLVASSCGRGATDATPAADRTLTQEPCAPSDGGTILGSITSPRPNATVSGARIGLIPNGDFGSGLEGWFVSDSRSARLERSERDGGEKLRLLAQPSADVRFVNSSRFRVTAGAEYKLVIGAGVAPQSAGLGIFSLVFLSTRELSRNLTRVNPPAGPVRYAEYTLSGTVPPGASQAMFQVSYDQREGTVDMSLYDVSYAETGTIDVTGWVLDRSATGPAGGMTGIDSVSLYLDAPAGAGKLLGTAVYGEKRNDLGRACGDTRTAKTDWRYSWDVRSVGLGAHTLYAVVRTADRTTTQLSTRIVMAPPFGDDPIGGIDVPVDGSALPDVTRISGWAIDRNSSSGSGVDAVSLYLDGDATRGTFLGKAEYGDARAGVALHFGDRRFANSGWRFDWDSSGVAPGSHTLSVVFQSLATGGSTTIARQVTVGGGREISLGKPAQASRFWQDSTPAMAVDGVIGTLWNSGARAPQWIEVDLEAPIAIATLRLVTAQAPWTGLTTHRIYGKGPDGFARLLHEFSGVTTEAQVLEYSPPVPWTGVRFLRVETVESEAWVAWREIGVYLERSTPTGRVSGLVRSSDAPVPGAQIELRSSDAVIQTTFTDESGAYAFVGIPPGTYAVRAYGPSTSYTRRTDTGSQILGAGAALQLEPLGLDKR